MVAILSPWLLATSTLLFPHIATSFTPPTNNMNNQLSMNPRSTAATTLASSTATEYDIVKVDLTDGRDYPIYIGSNIPDDEASTLLRKHIHGKRVLLITNDRIAPMYLDRYQKLLSENSSDGKEIVVDTVVLPDGEENKTFEVMSMVLDRALELGLDRKSTFVALGGGVIGDMVGFASAIYQRGVNFIQVCV